MLVPMAAIAEAPAPAVQPEQGDRRLIGVLTAAHLCDDVAQGAVPVILPFFIAAQHLSYAGGAVLVLAGTVASSVVQPLFGHVSDRRPAAWLAALGVFLAGLGVGLACIMPTYPLALAAMGLTGLGVAAFHPEATRLTNYASGPKRATAMSVFSVGGNAGFALGPLLATPLLITFGLRGGLLLALPASVMAVILLCLLPAFARLRQAASAGDVRQQRRTNDQWGPFARLTVTAVSRSIVFYGLNSFIPLYWLNVLHASTQAAGLATTLFAAVGACGTLLGGRLADRFGRKRVVVISFLVLVPAMLCLLTASSPWLAFALLGPVALSLYASNSVMVVIGQEFLPNHIGTASGVTLGLAFSIGGLAVPLLGHVADVRGIHTALLWLTALPVLAALVAATLPVGEGRARLAARLQTA
jgi:FSR family fosmidomycin resistance protein-like MFS transporter